MEGEGHMQNPPSTRAHTRTRLSSQASRAFRGLSQVIPIASRKATTIVVVTLQIGEQSHHGLPRDTPAGRVRIPAPAWGHRAPKPLLVASTLPRFPGAVSTQRVGRATLPESFCHFSFLGRKSTLDIYTVRAT